MPTTPLVTMKLGAFNNRSIVLLEVPTLHFNTLQEVARFKPEALTLQDEKENVIFELRPNARGEEIGSAFVAMPTNRNNHIVRQAFVMPQGMNEREMKVTVARALPQLEAVVAKIITAAAELETQINSVEVL